MIMKVAMIKKKMKIEIVLIIVVRWAIYRCLQALLRIGSRIHYFQCQIHSTKVGCCCC